MGQPAPIPRRSSHLGSAACYGRSAHGSHSSTSAASSRSSRHQGNHNRFQTLKMFPDGHSEFRSETATYLQDGDEQLRRLARRRSGGTTLHELARFYIDERVRHFYANGLALYGQSASWRTPFLSVPWVAEVEKLARHW